MGAEHMVMPPLAVAALPAVLGGDWIDNLAAEVEWQHPRLDVPATNAANTTMLRQIQADRHVAPAAEGTTSAASGDRGGPDVTGHTFIEHVDRHVDEMMRRWKAHASARGVPTDADSNAQRRKYREALRGTDDPSSVPLPPTHEEEPSVRDMLERATPASQIRHDLRRRFAMSKHFLRLYSRGTEADERDALGEDPHAEADIADVDRSVNMLAHAEGVAPEVPGSAPRALVPVWPLHALAAHALPMAPRRPDVILRVCIAHFERPMKWQEFLVLGSNSLEQLRDRIYCPSNHEPGSAARQQSYFYIDGVIYQDTRQRAVAPSAQSMELDSVGQPSATAATASNAAHLAASAQVTPGGTAANSAAAAASTADMLRLLEEDVHAADTAVLPSYHLLGGSAARWSRETLCRGHDSGWGALQLSSMQTRFDELAVRLGAHYLYCHQGSCEHLLVFSDARLVSSDADAHALDASRYPLHAYQARTRRRRCETCTQGFANFEVFGDRCALHNPAYLCDECYRLMHYAPDGTLRYNDFAVLPYSYDA